MMRVQHLPAEMRERCRAYFLQARAMHTADSYKGLMGMMSPMLRGELSRASNMQTLMQIWFLKDCSNDLIAEVAKAMRSEMYCPSESCDDPKRPRLCVVGRGVVGRGGRVLGVGKVWGEDVLLRLKDLRQVLLSTALTYVELHSTSQEAIWDIVESADHPGDQARLRWAHVRLTVLRGIPWLARKLKGESDDVVHAMLSGGARAELLPPPPESPATELRAAAARDPGSSEQELPATLARELKVQEDRIMEGFGEILRATEARQRTGEQQMKRMVEMMRELQRSVGQSELSLNGNSHFGSESRKFRMPTAIRDSAPVVKESSGAVSSSCGENPGKCQI